jgi:hypothetical protein
MNSKNSKVTQEPKVSKPKTVSAKVKETEVVKRKIVPEAVVPQKIVRVYMKDSFGKYTAHIRYGIPEDELKKFPKGSYVILSK